MAKSLTHIRSLARIHTDRAIQVLQGIMDGGQQESARIAAAKELLDRGWGKAAQPLTGGDDEDKPIAIQAIVRKIVDPQSGNSDGSGVPPAA
jgi:queuine/archaeosine tRNA-ribosyltransferase